MLPGLANVRAARQSRGKGALGHAHGIGKDLGEVSAGIDPHVLAQKVMDIILAIADAQLQFGVKDVILVAGTTAAHHLIAAFVQPTDHRHRNGGGLGTFTDKIALLIAVG